MNHLPISFVVVISTMMFCKARSDSARKGTDDTNSLLMSNVAATQVNNHTGPLAVTSSEYKLPPAVDPTITTQYATEIWGEVYRPSSLVGTYPLIVFLHGNHPTCGAGSNPINETIANACQYSFSGTCPAGSSVIMNHLGYEYLASRLASWGYVVVSINSNRGINCINNPKGDVGLNLARGRLILKHLAYLSEWNQKGGTPVSLGVDLKGHLDFSQVGLMGHSRGGEGVRAAYNQYLDAGSIWPTQIGPLTIRAIFEIAPVDGQTPRRLDANGTAWNVLLPMCDGDVVQFSGMMPYDRMLNDATEAPPLSKSMIAVRGANHNFYNSQWQITDSAGCIQDKPLWAPGSSSSDSQQRTAIGTVIPFFKSYVGATQKGALNEANIFNPSFPIPSDLAAITNYERAFNLTANSADTYRVETFSQQTGIGSLGQLHTLSNVDVNHVTIPEHDPTLHGARLSWNFASKQVFFQNNWAAAKQGINIDKYETLDFRLSRSVNSLNVIFETYFHVQLVFANGTLGPTFEVGKSPPLIGPLGPSGVSPIVGQLVPYPHELQQSVRIPMGSLLKRKGRKVRGIRFVFDGIPTGEIYISDISLSRFTSANQLAASQKSKLQVPPAVAQLVSSEESVTELAAQNNPFKLVVPTINTIERTQRSAHDPSTIEMEISSSHHFRVGGQLPVLRINNADIAIGEVPETGDTSRLVFRVNEANLQAMPDDINLEIGYKGDRNGPVRSLGRIKKAQVIPR